MSTKLKPKEKYQGREFTTTLQANTEAELGTMIKGLHDYARKMGIDDYEVIQKRPDPDGGWEATIKAHNWNPFQLLRDKVSSFKEGQAQRTEQHRQETLSELRVKRAREDEEKEKDEAELAERRRRKAEKETAKEAKLAKKREAKEAKLTRKREVEEAKAQADQAKQEKARVKMELRREKYAGIIKAGEIAGKALKTVGKVGAAVAREVAKPEAVTPKRESASQRRFREGAEGKVIGGEKYQWKASADRKSQLTNRAREMREDGWVTKIIKQDGQYQLYYRGKVTYAKGKVRITEKPSKSSPIGKRKESRLVNRRVETRRRSGGIDLGAGIVKEGRRRHIRFS